MEESKNPPPDDAPLMLDDDLSDLQLRFCLAYLVEPSAQRAAEVAGYSLKTAMQQSNRLLNRPAIQKKIASLRRERETRIELTADRVIQEIASMALGDPLELGDLCPPEIAKLPERVRRRITDWTRNPDGSLSIREAKSKSLELLGRHFGAFHDRIEVKHSSLEDVLSASTDLEVEFATIPEAKGKDEV